MVNESVYCPRYCQHELKKKLSYLMKPMMS